MKLIIDISEKAYKGCVRLKNNNDMEILVNATANGIPLEEELEKIAKEMKSSNRYSFEDLKIIDKHIAEIKGE